MFGFEPYNNKTPKDNKDTKIRRTLIAFLSVFFADKNKVLLFSADITDFKQQVRSRLFENWKNKYDKEGKLNKYNVEIASDEEIYFSSLIVHKENVHKKEYKEAFFLSATNLTK